MKNGYISAVLLQSHSDGLCPVAYYSQRLDSVTCALPHCLRAVAAASTAVTCSNSLVAYRPLTFLVPHAVASILLTRKTSHFSPSRRLHHQHMLLSLPHVTIKLRTVRNPATLFPIPDHGDPHDCSAAILSTITPRPDLWSSPLTNPDLVLYVDGCNPTGQPVVSYAVVDDFSIVESSCLPSHLSAQAAELFALTRACILAEGCSVTIYTDSRYAFGVEHDFGSFWKLHRFLTSARKPIQHHQLLSNLLSAILLPSQIAVCKCASHTRGNDSVSLGNERADLAAKAAAASPHSPCLQLMCLPVTPTVSLSVPPSKTVLQVQIRQNGNTWAVV